MPHREIACLHNFRILAFKHRRYLNPVTVLVAQFGVRFLRVNHYRKKDGFYRR